MYNHKIILEKLKQMSTTTQTKISDEDQKKLDEAINQMFDKEEAEKVKKQVQEHLENEDVEIIDESKDISFLNPVFLELFRNEPFLGQISMNITKVADAKMPTAYIGARPNGNSLEIMMGFNPKFMASLTKEQQFGVIKHEIYHMVFQHIFSRAMGDSNYKVLWNWATDLAINSIIGKENLPDLCLIPGHTPTDPKTGKPIDGPYAEYIQKAIHKQSSDHYFEELKKIQQEQGDEDLTIAIGSGIGTMDGHDIWDQLPADVQEQIRDKVRGMMSDAANNAQKSNSWGSIPQEIQQVIQKILSREVDWRTILRNFVGRTRTTERNSTIRKVNKKLPYIQPGIKRKFNAEHVVFIDQSGSMSDHDIALMFGELESLSSLTSIDVYHFDTEVDEKSHTVWKKGAAHPKPHRTRCGGTDFNAVADFMNDRRNRGKYASVIILTDGYAPVMKQIIGSKVLWVVTETGTLEHVRSGDLAIQMKKEKQFKKY
jgi:predicted metal-dependent peptidase